MNIGFGSLKQMNDTLRYNRELLGKKKSLRDRYKEEAKKIKGNPDNADPEEISMRIRRNVRRTVFDSLNIRLILLAISICVFTMLGWLVVTMDFTVSKEVYNTKSLFIVEDYPINENLTSRSEYFHSGLLAGETFLLNGRKHHNSQSWYESGELFRSATYYNDTLLLETYFFKSGDTIRNFPIINGSIVRRITFKDPARNRLIRLDFFDGKIIEKSYSESPLGLPPDTE